MIDFKDNDIKVAKIKREDIYEILVKKNKRIFDIIKQKEIAVKYKKNQIDTLCEILKDNKINCQREDLETYIWVRFNKNALLEFANFGPMDVPCKLYSFDEFVEIINI